MSLLLQMTLFLAAALLIVPLGMRLGIASVLGYLLTGVVLGPSVLNFAHDAEAIMHLAEFGVILLMFLIGLELRPQRLWQMRQSILVLGSWQVLATGAVLSIAVLLFLDVPVLVSVVIALALALSSTAFVLQLLTEKQQLHSSFGQQSFAILLLQDIAAIVLLALIPIVAGSTGSNHTQHTQGLAYFVVIIACFSGLFLMSRYVMRPFFRYVASSGAHELLTAVALFIVLAVVLLMDTFGISTTLGAFITGVMLAESEFRHQLEASIAPFKGLLLGLFFMTVGFNTPLHLLFSEPLLIVGAALGLMIIKAAILFVIGRMAKMNWRDSLMLGVCLSQGGEFAFVVLNVAVSEQLLGQAMLEPINLVVIVSMILTPLLYWLVADKLLPRFAHLGQPEYDHIPEHQHDIIIAGFNRFGQIIARVAHMQHLPFTAIDNNLAQIDFVRRYGGTLYYGDVTQTEILRAAGIAQAKVFVLAINDPQDSMQVVQYLKMHHPQLKILVRARDRQHVHLLRELGVTQIWREHLGSALEMATALLTEMGVEPRQAAENIALFRQFDEKLLEEQQSVYTDMDKIVESTRSAFAELEHLFASEARYQAEHPSANAEQRTQNVSDAAESSIRQSRKDD